MDIAENAVTGLPGIFDRFGESSVVMIAIAEDKMRRPCGEERDDLRRSDVAAVQHGRDVVAFEHPHRRPSAGNIAVSVADDADKHGLCLQTALGGLAEPLYHLGAACAATIFGICILTAIVIESVVSHSPPTRAWLLPPMSVPLAANVLVFSVAALAAIAVGIPLVWTIAATLRFHSTVAQGFLLGLNLLLNRLRWHTKVNRPMALSSGQGAVICANHRSGFDSMFVQVAAPRLVHWMVAKEYCTSRSLGWFFRILQSIPTGRGGIDTAAVKQAIRLAESGKLVGMMPEGRVNETAELLLPGRPGAALVALRARVPIVPCYIEGSPYNGKTVGPLFMRARVKVTVGDPIDITEYYGRDREPGVTEELTLRVLKEIARLGGKPDYEPQLAGRRWKPHDGEELEERAEGAGPGDGPNEERKAQSAEQTGG